MWRIFGFQSHFTVKIRQMCLILFLLKNIKLGEELLLATLFDYFHFWSIPFPEVMSNFWRAPINLNQFRWKNNHPIIYQWACSFLELNSTTVIMLTYIHILLCQISCHILIFIEKIISINLIKTNLYILFRKWYENTKWTFTSQQCAKHKLQWCQLEEWFWKFFCHHPAIICHRWN